MAVGGRFRHDTNLMFGGGTGPAGIPQTTVALAAAILVSGLFAAVFARRGGRYRMLPGWALSWLVFGVVLLALEHLRRAWSFPLLGALMFVSLRDYYFVAPVRPRDRYVILASYLAIPVALLTAGRQDADTFLATIPIALFLLIPAFLAVGRSEAGLLDSVGRSLLGVVFFVFCTAHLALFVGKPQGLLELFGVLVLSADLPQRIGGPYSPGRPWGRTLAGLVLGLLLATGMGYLLGPHAGISDDDGLRAGFFVWVAVVVGASVSVAVARDLDLKATVGGLSRGAFLDRMVPAVYAAPMMFHYIDHFA